MLYIMFVDGGFSNMAQPAKRGGDTHLNVPDSTIKKISNTKCVANLEFGGVTGRRS